MRPKTKVKVKEIKAKEVHRVSKDNRIHKAKVRVKVKGREIVQVVISSKVIRMLFVMQQMVILGRVKKIVEWVV